MITMLLIDLFFAVNRKIDTMANSNQKYYLVKAALSIAVLAAAIFVCVTEWKDEPHWVRWANSGLLLLCLILALLRLFPRNSIMVACLVSCLLNFTSLYLSLPYPPILFKGLLVLILLLGMLGEGSNILRTKKSSLNELLSLNTSSSEEDYRYVSGHKWPVYHFIMTLICLAIPSLLSSPSSQSSGSLH